MADTDRYLLTFSADADPHDTVMVHRTGASGPGGHPVYCDDTGIVRAEISENGEVRMLASSTHQRHRQPIALRPVDGQD